MGVPANVSGASTSTLYTYVLYTSLAVLFIIILFVRLRNVRTRETTAQNPPAALDNRHKDTGQIPSGFYLPKKEEQPAASAKRRVFYTNKGTIVIRNVNDSGLPVAD